MKQKAQYRKLIPTPSALIPIYPANEKLRLYMDLSFSFMGGKMKDGRYIKKKGVG